MKIEKELAPYYYHAACFYSDRGKEQEARNICNEGIETLLEIDATKGLETLYFQRSIVAETPEEKIQFLHFADHYAQLNENTSLKKQIQDHLH